MLEISSRTIRADFHRWFDRIPDIDAASWYMISDYCVGDNNKQNDAFSFAILLNHDTSENIASYIARVAPKDIKESRGAWQGLLDYLSCPVSFSVNFVVERQTSYLKSILTVEAMRDITDDLRKIVRGWATEEPSNGPYYDILDRRLKLLASELASKNPSLKLLRRIFLVASFAAIVLTVVNDSKSPIHIRWISDRDAMFDRHDGVAFDLGWLLFQLTRRKNHSWIDLRRPQIGFATPGMDGKTEYAEFVRLPDILAGTLADMRVPQMMFTHPKFPPAFNRLFVNSQNNAVIEIVSSLESVKARRITFGEQRA